MFTEQFNENIKRMSPIATLLLSTFIVCAADGENPQVDQVASVADRTTFFLPLPSDASTDEIPKTAQFPDAALGAAASDGWKAYMRLWKAHYADPADKAIRKYLGLPLTGTVQANSKRGRSAPQWMKWRPGAYQQIDTPHFTIYSQAGDATGNAFAEDLERCYWVWTQMFFPMWEGSAQVSTTLAKLGEQEVDEFLAANSSRITIRRKLRVVLFRDAAEYQKTLAPLIPGIERSTGFYNDDQKITFLYASEDDAAETRRHELVHQLFREASRSALGRRKPGEASDFWIVEGIAGYFESLHVGMTLATVGGWDSSRLQFARYRMLLRGDEMPIDELRADGRLAAQKRQDIARWYAHAIAQTHHFLDSGDVKQRIGLYQLLGREYVIKTGIAGGKIAPDIQRRLRSFLSATDNTLRGNPVDYPVKELCLPRCEITPDALSLIPASSSMRWLDLTGIPIDNAGIERLVPNPGQIEQLTLESTKIDNAISSWLGKASRLQELDLSWRPVGDTVIQAVSGANDLQVLWMTGSEVSDASIDTIIKMKNLESVDLQRTKVSPAGIAKLKSARPQLSINPVELRGN